MPRSLLLSFAHPDDESFFAAGTVRRHADQGTHVTLCCATRGERGAVGDPPLTTIDELPGVREQELRDAATAMGIAEVVFLPYEDQRLAATAPVEIRRALVALIRRTRPDAVITFDPNGGNGHVDHVAISRFTSDAVSAAADPRWFPESGGAHAVPRLLWVAPSLPWEIADPGQLAAHPGVDFVIDTWEQRAAKIAALAAHRTQHAGIDRLFLRRPDRDRVLGVETFRLGAGLPPRTRPAGDLFDGIAPG